MNALSKRLACALGVTLVLGLMVAEPAQARRGGSFGSRGSRTYASPAPTATYSRSAPPMQRSMTQDTRGAPAAGMGQQPGGFQNGGFQNGAMQQPRRGFGGMGGLLGGLAAGGLLGMMLGHGFGGMGGGLGGGMGGLLQIALLVGAAWLAFRFFKNRRAQQPAPAPFGQSLFGQSGQSANTPGTAWGGGGGGASASAVPLSPFQPAPVPTVDIGLLQADRDTFERLLAQVQDAFGREDYAALRAVTTPEIMSYLSEELSQNAVQGRRNEVKDTRLLQSDVSEAWREGDVDYATVAMRYESIDIMRDRQSGAVVSGDPDHATTTTELWTFVRHPGAPWKLSAIQEG
jgi:predicted lipid-binding transport protein (Tim44 family)